MWQRISEPLLILRVVGTMAPEGQGDGCMACSCADADGDVGSACVARLSQKRICGTSGEKEPGAFLGTDPGLAMGGSAAQGSLSGGGGGQEIEHRSGTGMGVGNRAYPAEATAMGQKGVHGAVQREEYSDLLQANPDGAPMGAGESERQTTAIQPRSADENPCDGARGSCRAMRLYQSGDGDLLGRYQRLGDGSPSIPEDARISTRVVGSVTGGRYQIESMVEGMGSEESVDIAPSPAPGGGPTGLCDDGGDKAMVSGHET